METEANEAREASLLVTRVRQILNTASRWNLDGLTRGDDYLKLKRDPYYIVWHRPHRGESDLYISVMVPSDFPDIPPDPDSDVGSPPWPYRVQVFRWDTLYNGWVLGGPWQQHIPRVLDALEREAAEAEAAAEREKAEKEAAAERRRQALADAARQVVEQAMAAMTATQEGGA